MSEPTTRNTIETEAARLAAEMVKTIGNDSEWRIAQAVTLSRIEAKQDHFQFVLEQHMQDDRMQFADIKSAALGVSSSVDGMKATENQIKGARGVAGWLGALVIAAVGVLVWLGSRIIEAVAARGAP